MTPTELVEALILQGVQVNGSYMGAEEAQELDT